MKKYAALTVQSSVLVPADASRQMLRAIAKRHHFDFTPRPGFLYVRSRAISSRTNDNYDEFPAEEIKKSYRTFVGKPVFVNHVNDNHKRARGVVIDSALHEDRLADGHPDTWAEVLMEIDAVRFPKLAEAIRKGRIDRTSMGTDVEYSVCSHCGNRATTPAEYCGHIPRLKGKKVLKRNASTGHQEEHLIREVCYGLRFFENSVLVEPPADPTAYFTGVQDFAMTKAASLQTTASNTEPIALMLQHWDKVNLGLGQNQPHQREESRAQLQALHDQGHTHAQRAGWESGKGYWKPVHPSTGVVPIEHAIGDYASRAQQGAGDATGLYSPEGMAEVYHPRVKALIDLANQGFTHARWGRDYEGDEVNKWHGAMPSAGPTKYSALERDDPDAVHLESHPGHPDSPTLCNRRGPQYKTHEDVGQATCEDCLREHEGGQECEEPYCQENGFPEGWHTKAEHMDPPHQDPNSDQYRDAEKAVRDAMGDHPLGFLLEQNEREDGTNGPSKYSKTAGVEPHDIARILDKASDSLGEEHQDDLHYVPDWEPLRKALPEHEWGSWMFMNRHQHPEDHVANVAHDPALGKSWEEMEPHFRGPGHHLPKATMPAPQGLVQYKHGITRQGLTLDEHGQAWRATRKEGYNGLGQGYALVGPYHPKSLLKEHYKTLEDWGHSTETKYDEDFIADRNKRLKDAGYDVVMGQTPHSSARKLAGMHGMPVHEVGDRVIDFRGEQSGTVIGVHDSNHPGKSNKVDVEVDGTENPPQGHPDHLYWHKPGEKQVSSNYENVWSPHPDAPQEQKDRHAQRKADNAAATQLLTEIEDEHGEDFDWIRKHQGSLTQHFASWDDDEDHDEEPRATRHCTRCGEWTTRDGYHTAYDDGKCPVPSTEEREQAIYDRLHPADYCHDNCRSGHAADLARGVGSHHIFNVDEGQDASISAGPHQEPVSRQSGTYEYRNPRDQALCHYCRAPLLHPDLPSSLGRRRHKHHHHHHRFVRNHPMHNGRGWVGGWGMGWGAGHPGYCCEHDSCVADDDGDASSDGGAVGDGGDGGGSEAVLTRHFAGRFDSGPCGCSGMSVEPHSGDEHAEFAERAYATGKTDAWGEKLMQPYDGHGAWSCNNYNCPEHPEEMYGRRSDGKPGKPQVQGMPGWMQAEHDPDKDLTREVGKAFYEKGLTEDARYLLDQQKQGPTKYSHLTPEEAAGHGWSPERKPGYPKSEAQCHSEGHGPWMPGQGRCRGCGYSAFDHLTPEEEAESRVYEAFGDDEHQIGNADWLLGLQGQGPTKYSSLDDEDDEDEDDYQPHESDSSINVGDHNYGVVAHGSPLTPVRRWDPEHGDYTQRYRSTDDAIHHILHEHHRTGEDAPLWVYGEHGPVHREAGEDVNRHIAEHLPNYMGQGHPQKGLPEHGPVDEHSSADQIRQHLLEHHDAKHEDLHDHVQFGGNRLNELIEGIGQGIPTSEMSISGPHRSVRVPKSQESLLAMHRELHEPGQCPAGDEHCTFPNNHTHAERDLGSLFDSSQFMTQEQRDSARSLLDEGGQGPTKHSLLQHFSGPEDQPNPDADKPPSFSRRLIDHMMVHHGIPSEDAVGVLCHHFGLVPEPSEDAKKITNPKHRELYDAARAHQAIFNLHHHLHGNDFDRPAGKEGHAHSHPLTDEFRSTPWHKEYPDLWNDRTRVNEPFGDYHRVKDFTHNLHPERTDSEPNMKAHEEASDPTDRTNLSSCPHVYPDKWEHTLEDDGERCEHCHAFKALHAATLPSEVGKVKPEVMQRRWEEHGPSITNTKSFTPTQFSLSTLIRHFAASSADRWVRCGKGHEHWGSEGAAGLLVRHTDDEGTHRYLLQHRSPHVDHGGTWSTVGGALHSGESPIDGAVREATEEIGNIPHGMSHVHTHTDDHGGWAYHTVTMQSPSRFLPHEADEETGADGYRWMTREEMDSADLHPGFAKTKDKVLGQIEKQAVGEFDHCVQCNKPITRVNPEGPVEWQHDATAGGVGIPHRAVPGGSPRPSEGGGGQGPRGGADSDAAAPGGCPGGVCGITPTGSRHVHLRSLAHAEETCEECGKPADHIHLDQASLDFYRQIHQYTQMASEMTQHAQQRVVNLSDPADLKAHMLEAHDLDDSDLWRNSHAHGHPALGPDTDEDRPLTHMEIHKLHDHDHGVDEYEGTTMGDSHFHTALRKQAFTSNPLLHQDIQEWETGYIHGKGGAEPKGPYAGSKSYLMGHEQGSREKTGSKDPDHDLELQMALSDLEAELRKDNPHLRPGSVMDAADQAVQKIPDRYRKESTWIGDHPEEPHLFWRAPKSGWEVHVYNHMPDRDLRENYGSKPKQDVVLFHPDQISPPHPANPQGRWRGGWNWERNSNTGEQRYAPNAWGSVAHGIPAHVQKQVDKAQATVDEHAANHADLYGQMAEHQDIEHDLARVPADMAAEEKGKRMFRNLLNAADEITCPHCDGEGGTERGPHTCGMCNGRGFLKKQAAKGLVRHDIKASEVREGDFLDIMGRTRVDLVHPNPPAGSVAFRTKTRGARSPSSQRHDPDAPLKVWRKPQDEKISTRIFSSLLRFFGSQEPEKLPGGFLNVESDPQDYWAKPTGKADYDPQMAHHGIEPHQDGKGPWHVVRHPETRAYHVVDDDGKSIKATFSTIGHPKYELHDHEAERRAYHVATQANQDHGHIPKWHTGHYVHPGSRYEPNSEIEDTGIPMGQPFHLPGTSHARRKGEPIEDGQAVDTQHVQFHYPAPPIEHTTEDPKIAEYKQRAKDHPAPKVYPPKVVTQSSSREHGTTYRQVQHGDPDYDKPGAFHASSPEDEWHGPYRVIQHPGTKKFHVVDNQDRITGYGGREGQEEQHRAEYMRDYADGRQASKEKGRALAEGLFNSTMEVLDPGGTPESRRTERHGEALSGLMHRYQGGDHHPLHPGKFGWDDQDEEGDEQGAPYYEVKDPAGSGWKARDYGGPHIEIHHEAVGPVDTVHVAEENNRNHDVIRDPSFGHDELHQVLHNFAHGDPNPDPRYSDDIDPDTGRGHAAGPDYARNEPDIERWQKRKGYRG